ncbi:MAG TPA: cation diffusion facilitator family transporter [Opitutaceae bacterium]|nr:cation diffusion facilitator family transporter [Opitutaceae bacterium]
MPELAPHLRDAEQRAQQSAALVARGIGLNLVLAIVKIAGGIFGHTYALIADGVESLLDILSSGLAWAGLRMAARPPDADHPYGHGKAESIAALLVSIVIFGVAIWIARDAIHEILTPHHGPHWGTLPLLAAVICVKIYFSRKLGTFGTEANSTVVGIEAGHHYSDALTSAAAFIGISIALVGGKGFEAADDWAALAACVIIMSNGVGFFRQAVSDMMDTAVPFAVEVDVRKLASSVPGVLGIDKLRVRKSGLSHLVDIHVEVDGELSVKRGHDIAGAVKHRLLGSPLHIVDVLVHIEPAPERSAQ